MARFRRYLTFLFAGIIGAGGASLLRAAPPGDEGPSFQLIALADFAGRDQLHYLRSATDAEPMVLPVLRRSASIEPRSLTAPLVFGLRQADPQTGAVTYRPVFQVDWPAGSPDRALVFVGTADNGAVAATAIDDSLKIFPRRTLRVVNFSGQSLLGKFGGFQGAIPAGPQPAVAYPQVDAAPGTTGRFRVGIARQDESGNAKLVYNGWTDAWANGRTLLLIRREGARLQVRAVVETLPEPQE